MSSALSALNRLLAGAAAIGATLIVVGVLVGTPSASVQGAYFSHADGTPSFAGAFGGSKPALLDPADGNLWLGAGVAIILFTMLVALARRIRSAQSAQDGW